MLKNYIKIVFRNIAKDKLYAGLNILGLTVGIASFLLIVLFLANELSFDRFHENTDRIYRVNQTSLWTNNVPQIAATSPAVSIALENEIPEIEKAVRINYEGDYWVTFKAENQPPISHNEENVLAADSTFFAVFSFNFLQGNPSEALTETNSVVITEATAQKYFQGQNPLGKVLLFGDKRAPFKVTAVVENVPDNSNFTFDFVTTLDLNPLFERMEWSWIWTHSSTYVLLKENSDPELVRKKVLDLPSKYAGSSLQRIYGYGFEEYQAKGKEWKLYLQALPDVHLYSQQIWADRLININESRMGDINTIYILSVIAFFILLIACINFMNLSTARSARRAKEVGVRKVLGSRRKSLMLQFLLESFTFSTIASLLALGLVELVRIPFNTIAEKNLEINLFTNTWVFFLLLGIIVLTGLLAGIYPAFYLTSFQPSQVLKGKISSGIKSGGFRNTLVVLQFSISIGMMICTAIVYQQVEFARNKKLGFNKENVLIVSQVQRLGEQKMFTFKESLKNKATVIDASISTSTPPYIWNQDNFNAFGRTTAEIPVNFLCADGDFLKTLDFEIKEGRFFSEDIASGKTGVIINEALAKQFNWKNPVGEILTKESTKYEVIGVVKDFHFQPMRMSIEPFALFHIENYPYARPQKSLNIRVQGDQIPQTIASIEEAWKTIAPDAPFEYTFLDKNYDQLVKDELKLGEVFTLFTSLAILIAFIGLLGLVAFTAEKRTKEIGIRKVLGASITDIIRLFYKEFSRLVLVAAFIATPLAYFSMKAWLSNFAYQVSIQWQVFVFAGAIALLLTLVIISYQSIKSAITDPVKSLRSE